ncbi:MAG: anti-sigma factor [Nitriliruptoraceae bacterium]
MSDVHTLTGAYVANALSDDERRFFERHLGGCSTCAAEVASLLTVTTRLAASSEIEPPAGMKSAVMVQIDETPQARRNRLSGRPRRTHARPVGVIERTLLPVAAVLALIAVVSTVMVANLSTRVDELEVATQRMTDVMNAEDGQFIQMEGPGGSRVRVVMSPQLGTVVFMVAGMEPAPHEHTYEVWLLGESQPLPVGLFDVDAAGRATHLVVEDMSGVEAIGVTIEPAGGSPVPSSDPIMVVPLRS